MEDCEAPAQYESEVYSGAYPIQVRGCSFGLVQALDNLENGKHTVYTQVQANIRWLLGKAERPRPFRRVSA